MKTFTSRLRQFVKSEDGISSVEYALLLAFVGAGIVGAAATLGGAVEAEITEASNCISTGTADGTTGGAAC